MGPPTTRPIAERVARLHAGILDAIANRDADLARERMSEHLGAVSHAAEHPPTARLVASV
jgi:DNA-binding FadR family transcriptional regulator